MSGQILFVSASQDPRPPFVDWMRGAGYAVGSSCFDTLPARAHQHALLVMPLDDALAHAPQITLARTDRDAPPILMLDQTADRARRLAGMQAGADDVLPLTAPEPLLRARMRALIRGHMAMRDLLPNDHAPVLLTPGLSTGDTAPARSGLLRKAPDFNDLSESLEHSTGHRLNRVTPDDLRNGGTGLDVLIVPVGTGCGQLPPDALADLRTCADGRHGAFLALTDPGRADLLAAAFDYGADDGMAGGGDRTELCLRIDRLATRKRQADTLRAALAEGWALAITDPLTGLPNRRAGLAHLTRCAERARLTKAPFAVLLIDFDHFKQVNDAHGHLAGDRVLTTAADRISTSLRPDDMLARIGGEEFLAILPNTNFAQARRIAERLRRCIDSRPFALTGGPGVHATISLGLAMGGGADGAGGLIGDADRALYAAKAGGRNRVAIARPRSVAA